MEEARKVLERLERIQALDQERAHPRAVLAELRVLVSEAEAWVRAEHGDEAATAAVQHCKHALEGTMSIAR